MRFLLKCVGFCVNSGDVDPSSPATPTTEETRSLVSPDTRLSRRRRGTSSSADWRPSLFAISEDNNGPVTPEKAAENRNQNRNRNRLAKVAAVKSTGRSRNVNRCAPSSVRVNANARSHDFGQNPLPMVIPAFSAAPFMF